MKINNATFRGWIRPGICLDVYADILSNQKKFARAEVRTEINGSITASAELLFTFEERSKLGVPNIDPVLDKYLKQHEDLG